MAETIHPHYPPVLLYGRTSLGVNVPVLVDASGHVVTTGGSPNPFDQNLNTTDSPTLANLTLTGDLQLANGKALKTTTTTAQTLKIQGYDVDGTARVTFVTVTNGNTPDCTISAPAGTTMVIQPTTYKSADGSTGLASGSITTGDLVGKTITVKNGLITAYA